MARSQNEKIINDTNICIQENIKLNNDNYYEFIELTTCVRQLLPALADSLDKCPNSIKM